MGQIGDIICLQGVLVEGIAATAADAQILRRPAERPRPRAAGSSWAAIG